MYDKTILKHGGTLNSIPDCKKKLKICNKLYVIIMSRTSFRVHLHSIVA